MVSREGFVAFRPQVSTLDQSTTIIGVKCRVFPPKGFYFSQLYPDNWVGMKDPYPN